MKRIPILFSIASAAAFAGPSALADTIDIRDCPLDTVVFVDPWAGGAFSVKKVGESRDYLCPEGIKAPDPECSGPFGQLVLEGDYLDRGSARTVRKSAVWTVMKAAPCCDWNVEDGNSAAVREAGFRWFDKNNVPRLRDMPFLSIESEYGDDFGNPLIAATCILR